MNIEDIMAMAKECGILDINYEIGEWDIHEVTSFASLIASAERDACAEIAEKQRYAMHTSLTSNPVQNGTAIGIANAIRARGDKHD